MKRSFEHLRSKFKNLNPIVREKALEIANRLIEEKKLSEEEAIQLAIKEAKEWFLSTQG